MNKIALTLFLLFFSGAISFGQWSNINSPASIQISAVSFPAKDTGFIGGTSGKVYKTTNGGANWSPLSSGTTQNIFAMSFTNTKHGCMCTGSSTSGTIYYTADGGNTWTAKGGALAYLLDIFFVNKDVGYCVGYDGVILKTINGGLNWETQTSGTTQDLRGVYFVDPDTGFVAAEVNEILKTTDGGATWESHEPGTSSILLSIFFTDSQNGCAVGGGGTIVKTVDGGDTWKLSGSNTTETFQSVYFTDAQTGYAVGGRGVIAVTANGGNSWASKKYGTFSGKYGWYGLTFSDSVGYAVGYEGNIATTTCKPEGQTDIQSACKSFTWMDGETYTSSTSSATYALTNAGGCDSIVTLHLTILDIDTTVSVSGNTITSNTTGLSYQWIDCGNGNAPINGEISNSFTATQSGTYAVVLTRDSCMDTSACISLTVTGIHEAIAEENWTLYPNPSDGFLQVDFVPGAFEASVQVFTTLGQRVYHHEHISGNRFTFSLNQPDGLYFIKIRMGSQQKVIRLVKE